MRDNRYRLNEVEISALMASRVKEAKENKVLVIGDIHAPFTRKDYLQFCIDTYNKYECNKVVFIGDIIDNHFSSYHETDADGLGGDTELGLAIDMIQEWYKAFTDA